MVTEKKRYEQPNYVRHSPGHWMVRRCPRDLTYKLVGARYSPELTRAEQDIINQKLISSAPSLYRIAKKITEEYNSKDKSDLRIKFFMKRLKRVIDEIDKLDEKI